MVKLARVEPKILHQENYWGAELFCSDAALVFQRSINGIILREIGNCIEGWRVSTNKSARDYDRRIETTPIYRQANLKQLNFDLEDRHWKSPEIESQYCVRPGDLTINKISPLRASLATARLPRHPVDANCILIRGVKEPLNTWLAICLNQKPYEAYLLNRHGLSILARIGLKVLSQLYVPLPPLEEIQGLHQKIVDWNEQLLENDFKRVSLLAEVEDYIDKELEAADVYFNYAPLNPGQFFPSDAIADSLLPEHVRLSDRLTRLKRESGWIDLKTLLGKKIAKSRLSKSLETGRYLRLSDTDRDLTFSLPEAEANLRSPNRIFAKPLTQEEVLISNFIAPFKVVFSDESPSKTVYVSDSWERLRFKETPGAWALVLNTKMIQTQLSGMAIGSIQQHIRPENIPRLVIPNVPLKTRQKWEQKLLSLHKKHRELLEERRSIDREAKELFNRVHKIG